MRCIATGVLVDEEVNVDKCKEVGGKVLRSMVGKMRTTTDFVRKTQAVTLACKTAVRLTEGKVQVDPQLLFQRLSFVATGGQSDIIAAVEKSLVSLYKGGSEEGLDSLRYSRFYQKITTGTSFVQPEFLPLTSAAAVYHSLRAYHQVQQ